MLLTLEGLDGSGKTTAWEALQAVYPDATFTSEPTDTWYGEAVRRSLGEDTDPISDLFLFTADHADHLSRVVKPALADGELVISDRFTDSRYAYQAASLADTEISRPLEYIRGVHSAFTREPDATIYLDVDPETAAARAGASDKFERASFLAEVQSNYERLIDAEPERFVRVDASRSPEEVLDSVERSAEQLIEAHGDD
ncbi:dTMP kinase [Halobaculum limi]|uniref:dTMP kinase n=1 Tax=Halobaculum limi TaxID=3031916 RepID=UPI002406EB29|nr:dTMP kinase [Halobaculum sp. YSMS11]